MTRIGLYEFRTQKMIPITGYPNRNCLLGLTYHIGKKFLWYELVPYRRAQGELYNKMTFNLYGKASPNRDISLE